MRYDYWKLFWIWTNVVIDGIWQRRRIDQLQSLLTALAMIGSVYEQLWPPTGASTVHARRAGGFRLPHQTWASESVANCPSNFYRLDGHPGYSVSTCGHFRALRKIDLSASDLARFQISRSRPRAHFQKLVPNGASAHQGHQDTSMESFNAPKNEFWSMGYFAEIDLSRIFPDF